MKKSFKTIVLSLAVMMVFSLFGGVFSLRDKARAASENPDLYYSVDNHPVLYGASKITLSKNAVDSFSIKDPRFRVYARDFEDGDLEVTASGAESVNITTPGTYTVTYTAQDSDSNTSSLSVQIEVTNDDNKMVDVERIVYTIPNDWNMSEIAGFSRCNTGDRQNFGIYLPAGAHFKFRILDGGPNMGVNLLANDSWHESGKTVSYNANGNEFTDFVNQVAGSEPGTYSSVPLLTSVKLARGGNVNTTYKVEVAYNADEAPKLNYYYQGEDEQAFKTEWKENHHDFAIIENQVLTMLVPYSEIDSTLTIGGVVREHVDSTIRFQFHTLDEHLEYYQKVVDEMDRIIGLEYNPTNPVHQNLRARYLVKANKHGAGAAYYSGNHVGINNASMAAFFEMNWGGLHEIAHGYQGYLGKGEMGLGEVSNNIIGHYIQMNDEIFTSNSDWLGKLEDIETGKNAIRTSGQKFGDLGGNPAARLYVLINLFDYFDGQETYTKLFRYYREKRVSGEFSTSTPNQDMYALFFADEYHTNILPYWNEWGLVVSEDTREAVVAKSTETLSILADSAGNKADQIAEEHELGLKFGLVSDSLLDEYDIKGNLTIRGSAQPTSILMGRAVVLERNGETIYAQFNSKGEARVEGLGVGGYVARMPFIDGYDAQMQFINIDAGENEVELEFEKRENTDFHPVRIRIRGYTYDTEGFNLYITGSGQVGTIQLGAAGLGNSGWGSRPDDLFMSVTIKDARGRELYKKEVRGAGFFTTVDVAAEEIGLGVGCTISIYTQYPNLVEVYSMINGEKLEGFQYSTEGQKINRETTLDYRVTDYGIEPLFKEDFSAKDALYDSVKDEIIQRLGELKEYFEAQESELDRRYLSRRQKAEFLDDYNRLKAEDRAEFEELAERMMTGGAPTIEVLKDSLTVEYYKDIDWNECIKATDLEDGLILLGESNLPSGTNVTATASGWNKDKKGTYRALVTVFDSDGNSATCTITVTVLKDTPNGTWIYYLVGAIAIVVVGGVLALVIMKRRHSSGAKAKN